MAAAQKRSTRSQAAGKRASVAKAPVKARAKAPAKPPAARAVTGASPAPARVARPVSGGASTVTRGKYVYCIIRASQALKFGPIGIGTEPAEVHSVGFKEIAAV